MEDTDFADYLLLAYNLGEILYCKRKNTTSFETYGYGRRFDFPFPSEFIYLVNRTLTAIMIEQDISMIYYAEAKKRVSSQLLEPSHFTSIPTKSKDGEYYARFNSPLRDYDAFMNLYAYNEFVFKPNFNKEKYKRYQLKIADYVRIQKRYDEE